MPTKTNSPAKKPAPKKKADSQTAAPGLAMEQKAVPAPEPKPAAPTPEVTEAPAAPRKEGLLDFVLAPFNEWLDFIKKNWMPYYLGLLKIEVVNLVATLALLVVLGAILGVIALAGFGMDALTNGTALTTIASNVALLVAAVAIIVIMAVPLIWISATIKMSAIVFTDASFNGEQFSIREACWRIKGKVLRYLVFSMAIGLVIAIPVIIVGAIYLLGAGAMGLTGAGVAIAAIGGTLVFAIAFVYLLVVGIIYFILTQFWQYGFLVEGLGVRDSLKKAVGIVRMRLAEVLTFDVILVIGVIIFSIPLVVYVFGESIIEAIVKIAVQLTGNEALVLATAIVIYVVDAVLRILLGTITSAFSIPAPYLFWKKVK